MCKVFSRRNILSALVIFLIIVVLLVSSHAQENLVSQNEESIILTLPLSLGKTEKDRNDLRKLADIINKITKSYHREITGAELSKLLIQGLTKIDPHTTVLTPRATRERDVQMRGQFGGIGAEVQKNSKGGVLIVSPIDGTPADKAGIKPGDIIIAIDKKSVLETPLLDAVKLLRGKPGRVVALTIARKGVEKPIKVNLVRAIIKIRILKSELKKDGFGYIRLSTFASVRVPQSIEQAVKLFKQENGGKDIRGLILDLRRNPGGLLSAADGVNDLFLDKKKYIKENGTFDKHSAKTISKQHRGSLSLDFYFAGAPGDILNGAPLLILVDRGSASASEIVAGVLQIHGRAIIAGPEKTFGKGSVQAQLPLLNGGTLSLTTSQYVIGPTGCEKPVQGLGITPDILLQPKGEASLLSRQESDLENTLSTSTISNANCKNKKTASAEHMDAALKMLEIMNLKPLKEERK